MKIDSGILYKSLIKSYYTKSDAQHIVSCVRNCEGINPKAVPDLLEACKMLDGYTNHKLDTLAYYRGFGVFLKNIKQAIAKAEEK